MKKLLFILLISNALFAQEKPTSISIFWKPLFNPVGDHWGYGNKVGLSIEKNLSKKFDLTFNINNGNYTYSSHNVNINFVKKSIIDLNLNARFMFSRERRVNTFIIAGGDYSKTNNFSIDYLFNETENKNFTSTRDSYIRPYANLGLRFGKEHRRFVVDLTLLGYNITNGFHGSRNTGYLKIMLKLK